MRVSNAAARPAPGWALALAGVLAAAGATGCLPASSEPGAAGPPSAAAARGAAAGIPAGYGTLRQDDITLELRVDGVQLRVTPLAEGIIRLTAPDTWERLSAARVRGGAGAGGGSLFLVAVHTEEPGGGTFEPMDLEIASQGTVHRATSIVGLTPGWGTGRLRQRATEQAVYVFPAAVDPDTELVVQMGRARNESWAGRIPLLEAERARVRARAGIG